MSYKTIQDKINEYETGSDYSPLHVVMDIHPPLYVANPWIYLDGILSYLCLREALGEDYWNLQSDQKIDISQLDIPLKHTGDVYHTSVGIYSNPCLYKNIIYKRFTDRETYKLSKRKQKGKIRTNAGHYKDFIINLPLIATDCVEFYCCGDKKELTRLLSHLRHIGKKASIGGGYIKNTSITVCDMDYSFFKDDKIMRPVPSNLDTFPILEGSKWMQCTYKPPYWDKNNIKLCRVPENQLI